MRNIALFIAFDGTDFHGFQVQPNGVTVQETVQSALEQMFKHPTTVTGCSRTDSGVHAKEFCLLTKTDADIPLDKLPIGLNNLLPPTISALRAYEVSDDFHPRYSVVSKEYEYHIFIGKIRNPFREKYTYCYHNRFDLQKMKNAARYFEGKHDFAGFMASGSDTEDTVRTVLDCHIEELTKEEIVLHITADGFLYNMVRIIVGTLLKVASGNIRPEELPDIIASKDRSRAGFTAPAKGLFLSKVTYGEEAFSHEK